MSRLEILPLTLVFTFLIGYSQVAQDILKYEWIPEGNVTIF